MMPKVCVSEVWERKDDPTFKVRVIKTSPLVVHAQNLDDWKATTYTNDEFARLYTKPKFVSWVLS